MKIMRYITGWCLIIVFNFQLSIFNCSAQEAELKRERVFTGSGLYGFMNGGADQFLEYGVQRLVARDIVYEGEEYSIEVYEMPTAEDAFGIYSLHTFRCSRADTLGCIDCLSPYQLQAVAGNQYVSVVFPSGSDAAKQKADEVIRKYVTMSAENLPAIPSQLETKPPFSGRLKYLRGPISLSSASSSLTELLKDIPYDGVWFEQERRSKTYRALIRCSNAESIERIKEKVAPSDILETGNDYIYINGKEKEETEADHGDFGF